LTTLAIVSALLDEQKGLLDQLHQPTKRVRAGRTFWCGQWAGHDVVLVLSKVGKVAAASTTATLIEAFGAERVLFTGVAGGIGDGVKVGDVVVADSFIQHDMDSGPLFPRYEIPLYGRSTLDCDSTSGFNVYPNEVEDVVSQMPGIMECACVGVPDEKSGEAVKLVIVRKDPNLTEAQVRAYCKDNMTGYKHPKIVEFRTELPKTPVGKILRRELRGK